jgi:fructan beta-fructosidase
MNYLRICKGFLLFITLGFLLNACQTGERSVPEAAYREPYRPQFHFTPPRNWINDPNGLVYHDGEYHLFYQHNPFGDQWGHMSWGHAVSEDLVHWQHLPVALKEENDVMIFSGSAVSDLNNTSGFGSADNPPLVAIYTGHHTNRKRQDQRIAYSLDNGRTWTKYEGNPVIDGEMEDFRDPKVIWHEPTEKWIMIVALPTEHKVRFYGSPNLTDWELLSEFGPAGATGGVWECPDLFPLAVDGNSSNVKWVLQVDLNPGAPFGGSGGQYFVGAFEGTEFVQDPDTEGETRWVDYGKDFYAVQSYANIPEADGRRIWLAWMNNWQYAGEIPTSPWRGAMTIPREVSLKTFGGAVHLVQQPVAELQQLRGQHRRLEDLSIDGIYDLTEEEGIAGKAFEIVARFETGDAGSFGFNVRESTAERTVVGYAASANRVFVERSNSGATGFSEHFPSRQEARLLSDEGVVTLHVLVDWSSVEVFANGGEVSITDRIFPSQESERISLFSEGGPVRLISLDVWKLRSVWNNE